MTLRAHNPIEPADGPAKLRIPRGFLLVGAGILAWISLIAVVIAVNQTWHLIVMRLGL